MPNDDDLIVLGTGNLQRRDRTNKAGVTKQRYTVKVSGDSILVQTDASALGQGVAEAMANVLRNGIRGITAKASQATLNWRKSAVAALTGNAAHREVLRSSFAKKEIAAGRGRLLGNTGEWARRRYSGGRLGAMSPNQSDRLFNDSGRLADSIAVGSTKDGYWVVNVAANRFDPSTLGGDGGALTRIYRRLVELVPEFGDPARLMANHEVNGALVDGIKGLIQKADERTLELKKQRMQAVMGLARQLLRGVG
jgi:hypothetical protein